MEYNECSTTRLVANLTFLVRPAASTYVAGAGESRGGSPRHMKVLLMAAAFPP
jgi:hypothetical protein